MTNWFECTAKFVDKDADSGKDKKVSRKYLVSAVCVTDAERTVVEMLSENYSEIEISSAVAKPISEVFRCEDADAIDARWYRCKVMFVTVDEKTGKDKRTPSLMMVHDEDIERAIGTLRHGMHGTMCDWELHTIAETAIIDVIG